MARDNESTLIYGHRYRLGIDPRILGVSSLVKLKLWLRLVGKKKVSVAQYPMLINRNNSNEKKKARLDTMMKKIQLTWIELIYFLWFLCVWLMDGATVDTIFLIFFF